MYHQTPAGKYLRYRDNAKRRAIEFNLTKKEFISFVIKNCSYCGSKESIGVDRIDNEIGYTIENSTSCCTMCNFMKKNFPVEMFLEQCRKIWEFNQV